MGVFGNLNCITPFHCVKSKDNPFVLRSNLYTAYSLIFATVVRTVNKGSLNVPNCFETQVRPGPGGWGVGEDFI